MPQQAHHLHLDFYDPFFGDGAYGRTHANHLAAWHERATPSSRFYVPGVVVRRGVEC